MIGPIIPSLLELRKIIDQMHKEQFSWVSRAMEVYMRVIHEHGEHCQEDYKRTCNNEIQFLFTKPAFYSNSWITDNSPNKNLN
jgi:hypothetical protein